MTRKMSAENERRTCTDLGVVDVRGKTEGGTNGVREESAWV